MVNQEKNDRLTPQPSMNKLQEVVFSINSNFAAWPDSINVYFFQKSCNVINQDLMEVVLHFFCDQEVAKNFSHSCIVLLTNMNTHKNLKELRPISLRNFINKVISKLLSTRLSPIRPNLITLNQSCFVKGRCITENIMVAQEITHKIKSQTQVAMLLSSFKLLWPMTEFLRFIFALYYGRWVFRGKLIYMVRRIIDNNCFFIIINRRGFGFFQQSSCLKLGDPFFPDLFIYGAEILSRYLNSLHIHQEYHVFVMERRGPHVNHFSFEDDTIFFTLGRVKHLQLTMQTLRPYENASVQLINFEKSHFMVHQNVFDSTKDIIKRITDFIQNQGTTTYVGCPLFVSRSRISYFTNLVSKVIYRIKGR